MAVSDVQKQRTRLKIFSWSGAALVAAILIVFNFIVSYLPLRLDTSKDRIFSISTGSKSLVKRLDDTLLVRIMFSAQLPANYRLNEKYLADLLSEYKRASGGKIRVEYFDPSANDRGRETAISEGVVPVQLDVRERDRREVKECFMGVSFLYGDKRGSIPIVQDSQNLEYEITVQIKKLLDPQKPTVGVVKTGGALTFDSKTLQPLADGVRQLYNIVDVDITQPVPDSIKALWLMGPGTPYDSEMIDHIKTFLNRGGSVGLLLDDRLVAVNEFRTQANKIGLEPLLDYAGLVMKHGLVFDQRCDRIQIRASQGAFQMINIVDYPYIPTIVDIDRTHPATKGIDAFTMPFVSPIEVSQQRPGLNYIALARSSELSYLDTNPISVNPLQERYRQPDAPNGPFTLGMIVEGSFASTPSSSTANGRLIVLGSSKFIQTDFPVKQTNLSLFVNLMDWSVQDNVLLQIRSKGLVQKPIKNMPDGIRIFLKLLMMFLVPVLSLVLGLVVWQRQKVRRALLPLQYQDLKS